MFVIVDRNEKAFQNKYFMSGNIVDFLDKIVDGCVEINVETPSIPMSLIVYCDELSEDDLVRYHNQYYDYDLSSLMTFTDYENMTSDDIFEAMGSGNGHIAKIM